MKKALIGLFSALLFAAFSPTGAFAQLSGYAAPTTLSEGDAFQLYIRQDGKGDTPDFSVLERDFIVAGQRNSYKSTYINGKAENFSETILTLYPKKTGKITVPPIKAGKEETQPIEITVVPGNKPLPADAQKQGERQGRRLFMRAEVENPTPFVQEQTLYTVRLYSSVPVLGGTVTPPATDGVVFEAFGDPTRAQTVINGEPFSVLESKFLVFPQKSGEIILPPTTFQGSVADPNARDPFDFGGDFFGGFGGFSLTDPFARTSTVVRSKTVRLDVRPRPAEADGSVWLPASDVSVSEDVTPPKPTVAMGDALTRTVTVMARGVRDSQIPDPTFPDGAGYKQYPGRTDAKTLTDSQGVIGVKTRQIVFMPTRAGELTLPEMEVPWFDTKSQTMKTARLPSRTVVVTPAEGGEPAAASEPSSARAPVIAEALPPKPAGDAPASAGETRVETAPAVSPLSYSAEILLALGAAGGGAFVGLLWLIAHLAGTRKKKAKISKADEASRRKAVKDFKNACLTNDPAKAKEALTALARVLWRDDPPLTLSDIAGRFADDAFFVEMENLNEALYAKEKREWNGFAFWKAFASTKQYRRSDVLADEAPVPPLYPKG